MPRSLKTSEPFNNKNRNYSVTVVNSQAQELIEQLMSSIISWRWLAAVMWHHITLQAITKSSLSNTKTWPPVVTIYIHRIFNIN